jgi:N-methylhydantoinase A
MEEIFAGMERQGRDGVARGGVSAGVTTARGADMRYVGQEHAVTVALPTELFVAEDRAGIKRAFDAVHEIRYGFSSPAEAAEIVSLRSTVTGALAKPRPAKIAAGGPEVSVQETRRITFAGEDAEASVVDRAVLRAGNRLVGPAVIEEYASTTVLYPGDRLTVDEYGNLVIEIPRGT